MEIEAELARIIINEMSDQQIIVIREKGGMRSFPIVIGIVEIFAIDRRLKGLKPPRPLTHDLLDSVIRKLGGSIERIVITDLREHTFIATIRLHIDGRMVEVDSRPSDAIALGVASNTPIFVEERVFDEASRE